MTRPSDPYLQAHTVVWIDEAEPRTATEWNRAASEVERLGWYRPARAWARILLGDWGVTDAKIAAPLKEDPVNPTHQEISYSYPFDDDAIRADIARINAEYARRAEANRPTPEGTAKIVRTIFDQQCLLLPIVDTERLHNALVDALEPIFTSIWARGFDDGQEQLRDDLRGVLDDI